MKKILAALALTALPARGSPGADAPVELLSDDPAARPLLANLDELKTYLARQVSERKIPSLAAGIVSRQGLIGFLGFGRRDLSAGGEITPDTVFELASVTKVFVGVAVLQLRDAGLLSLDDPVEKYIPAIAQVSHGQGSAITIRHLLTHTSGLPKNWPRQVRYQNYGEAKLLAMLPRIRLSFAPGSAYLYSNVGSTLAGLIVAKAAGAASFADYANEKILQPLQMSSSAWSPRDVPAGRLATGYVINGDRRKPGPNALMGAAAPQGGLYSSVRDLARFAQFELAPTPGGPLSPESVKQSHQKQPLPGEISAFWELEPKSPSGYLVRKYGEHASYRAAVMLLPARGLGLIVLQGTGSAEGFGAYTHRALQLLASGRRQSRRLRVRLKTLKNI